MMKLIPNWQDQRNICWVCGTTKSVKYSVPVMILDTLPVSEDTQKEVCICNKCALLSVFTGEDPKCETH